MWEGFWIRVLANGIGVLLSLGILWIILLVSSKLEERNAKMGLRNDQLFQKAKDALEEYFSDRSVAPEITRDRLEEISENLSDKIGSLEIDIARLNDDDDDDDYWVLTDCEEDDE